jgi:MFS family permease
VTTLASEASFPASSPPAEAELPASTRRDLAASVGDAASFSVMVGIGETYIAPFAVALGIGGVSTGLLTTLPIFAGSILQLVTPRLVKRWGSHQKWVVACAITQGIALLLLPVAILLGGWSAALVYVAAALYWGSGQAGNPAWNTWIEDVIPVNIRTRFFARRSRISQVFLLVGLISGGLLLQYGRQNSTDAGINWTLLAFTGLFIAAALCRFTSATFLANHSEPNRGRLIDEHISLAQWSRRLKQHSGAKLLLFLFAMQTSVYISGPYFTPYMLRELGLSYGQFMLLASVCILGKALALPFWGRFAHRYGARKLLWTGALSILPLSSLWIVSSNFAWIAAIQFLSGLTWAAFELAIVLMFFEAIPRHERTSLVTLYNLSNSAAMVCGTFVGALVLRHFSESLTGYSIIFGMSSCSRILAVLLLMRLSKSEVAVPHAVEGALSLHPTTHSMDKPILPGIPETRDVAIASVAESREPRPIVMPVGGMVERRRSA